eukprot:1145836-Pelagomonas_calceolata.AAC.24
MPKSVCKARPPQQAPVLTYLCRLCLSQARPPEEVAHQQHVGPEEEGASDGLEPTQVPQLLVHTDLPQQDLKAGVDRVVEGLHVIRPNRAGVCQHALVPTTASK